MELRFAIPPGGVGTTRTEWEANQTGGDYLTDGVTGSIFTWVRPGSDATGLGGTGGELKPNTAVIIRVRGTAPAACSSYKITFSNG